LSTNEIVMGVIQLIAAVFLIFIILMQSGKSSGLSGSIAGGAETFFGKSGGKSIDNLFGRITKWVAIVFAILTIVLNLIAI
jgi:preprotein translocase subunit SecG